MAKQTSAQRQASIEARADEIREARTAVQQCEERYKNNQYHLMVAQGFAQEALKNYDDIGFSSEMNAARFALSRQKGLIEDLNRAKEKLKALLAAFEE